MRIIRHENANSYVMRSTCRVCKTDLEFTTDDLVAIENFSYDGIDKRNDYEYICPRCGQYNVIFHKKIPGYILKDLEKRSN